MSREVDGNEKSNKRVIQQRQAQQPGIFKENSLRGQPHVFHTIWMG